MKKAYQISYVSRVRVDEEPNWRYCIGRGLAQSDKYLKVAIKCQANLKKGNKKDFKRWIWGSIL